METLSTSLEDYLEAVYTLSRADGFCRATGISRRLKVSKPSVNAAVKALAARGLLVHERYGYVRLTPKGEKTGARIAGHHHFLKDFLMTVLGLGELEAERDACRAEHALSPATLLKLRAMSDFLKAEERTKLLSALKSALAVKPPRAASGSPDRALKHGRKVNS